MQKSIFLLLLGLLGIPYIGISQTQEKAKQLFKEGKYAEAKPAFKRFVKQNPRNANWNYWYGACCYETGEKEASIPYLKFAAGRDVREAYRYLAQYYDENYRFNEAADNWETYFKMMEKAKKSTDTYRPLYEHTLLGKQMINAVQDVTVIDSFVVDKTNFLQTYRLSKEAGVLETYNHYFKTDAQPDGIVYQTEMGNHLYCSMAGADGQLKLYSSDLIGDGWGERTLLNGIPSEGNINYPYMLSDGITFYYAAEGNASLGGYDIFVTRYDSEDNKFLVPENIGMPFNSPYNDYMYVVDEYRNLGWFASDRFQPEGRVCIYVFIPVENILTLNPDNVPADTLQARAKLTSIQDTWNDKPLVREGKRRLAVTVYERPLQAKRRDFEFIIDDLTVYCTLEEFKSDKARELFKQFQQEQKNYTTLRSKLSDKREAYAKANVTGRQRMNAEILDLEQRAERMEEEIVHLERETRNTEISFLHGGK